jgi:hypothetical protein
MSLSLEEIQEKQGYVGFVYLKQVNISYYLYSYHLSVLSILAYMLASRS